MAGAAVRFATLDLQSYGHDEAVTATRVIDPSLADTLHRVESSERSPPLYYLLAWLWSRPFGVGEVGLRSLSALIGTLTVPAAYLLGRNLATPRTGLVLSALVALSPILVWYSQEARSYALVVLFVTLGLALFAAALRRPAPSTLAAWAACSALALSSHYFAAFVIAPQALWLLSEARPVRRAIAAVGAVAVVGTALLVLALAQQGDDRRDGFTERPIAERAGELGVSYFAGPEPRPFALDARVDAVQAGASAIGLGLVVAAIALLRRRGAPADRRSGVALGVIALAGIGGPIALAYLGLDLFNPRNALPAAIPVLALIAVGLAGGRAGRPGLLACATALTMLAGVVVASNVSEQMQRPNWRGAAEAMGEATGPRLIVAPRNGDDPLLHYLDAARFGPRFQGGVRVDEVLALSTTFEVAPPPGFRLAERWRRAPLFILWRFEAPRPRRVMPADVLGNRVLGERDAALVEGIDRAAAAGRR